MMKNEEKNRILIEKGIWKSAAIQLAIAIQIYRESIEEDAPITEEERELFEALDSVLNLTKPIVQ